MLRAPVDGVSYALDELAGMLHRRPATVRGWIARGFIRRGRCVAKLAALRIPVGRVAPGELCRFLGRVNRQCVVIRERDSTRSPEGTKVHEEEKGLGDENQEMAEQARGADRADGVRADGRAGGFDDRDGR